MLNKYLHQFSGPLPGRPAPGRAVWARAAPLAAAVVIAAHGLVHVMGVALLWKLGEPGQLRYADAIPAPGSVAGYLVGGLWLVVAGLFVAAGVLLVRRRAAWRAVALAAMVVPAPVIGLVPGQAVAGLVNDGLVLLLVGTRRPLTVPTASGTAHRGGVRHQQ